MKKLILILSILTASYSVYADEGLYLKGSMGLNHINKSHHKDSLYTGDLKLKRFFPVIGLGVGYEFANNFRVETMIDYYFLFSQGERSKIDKSDLKKDKELLVEQNNYLKKELESKQLFNDTSFTLKDMFNPQQQPEEITAKPKSEIIGDNSEFSIIQNNNDEDI